MVAHRTLGSFLLTGSLALLGGCRVEQTPAEFIDHEDSIETERAAASAEVRDRVLAFGAAVARGSPAEALIALQPQEDVRVIGPEEEMDVEGVGAVRALILRLAGTPTAVRVRDVSVQTGPAANIAWFSVLIEAPGSTPEQSLYRATGIYLRDAGLWELVQLHVAGPITAEPPSSPPEPGADPEAVG